MPHACIHTEDFFVHNHAIRLQSANNPSVVNDVSTQNPMPPASSDETPFASILVRTFLIDSGIYAKPNYTKFHKLCVFRSFSVGKGTRKVTSWQDELAWKAVLAQLLKKKKQTLKTKRKENRRIWTRKQQKRSNCKIRKIHFKQWCCNSIWIRLNCWKNWKWN